MKICIVGAGYVGLVSAAVLAHWGHEIVCVDKDEAKINALLGGELPLYEEGLQELVEQNMKKERLVFTTDFTQALVNREVVILAVGTPSSEDGHPNLSYLWSALRTLKLQIKQDVTLIIKSTVPVGTCALISQFLNKDSNYDVEVISAPEFLRQGSAVYDFQYPDRLVIGYKTEKARVLIENLFQPLNCTKVFTDWDSSEMIKYASNAFLAMKISYINTIANLCDAVGGNIKDVAYSVGLDRRIGSAFLNSGVGFGGSCLPKDTRALVALGEANGVNVSILRDVLVVNYEQRLRIVNQLKESLGDLRGKNIAILGLAFKANTDDVREAPSITIISIINKLGGQVRVYDPIVNMENLQRNLSFYPATDHYETFDGADAAIILTDWEEFRSLDLERIRQLMNTPLIIDGRGIFEEKKLENQGFLIPQKISPEQDLISA